MSAKKTWNRIQFLKTKFQMKSFQLAGIIWLLMMACCSQTQQKNEQEISVPELGSEEMNEFKADLKRRTFNYFWEVIDSSNYQSDDRFPNRTFTSIAATGFALASYCIGAENGFVSREAAAVRTVNVLNWLWNAKQSNELEYSSGYKGFFYHFLTYKDGVRYKDVELSTIDTALLMAGILTAQSYFTRETTTEAKIRDLAEKLYRRVEWNWAMNGQKTMSMGWKPESGFIKSQWKGYNEAMILLILGLGSPTNPIPDDSWNSWTSTYDWENFMGYNHVNFGPLFGHQYSQLFVDFKGIQDAYMREKGIDYFENSRRATLSNREYCIVNAKQFKGYSPFIWGLTASDGPANIRKSIDGKMIEFKTYNARGVAFNYLEDDGTIVPTAAGGSIPFASVEALQSLWYMKNQFGEKLYQKYGFVDSFNLTYDNDGWFNEDYLAIDQGPILIQLENYESSLIWNTLKQNPHIQKGLLKAGFNGGWLDQIKAKTTNTSL